MCANMVRLNILNALTKRVRTAYAFDRESGSLAESPFDMQLCRSSLPSGGTKIAEARVGVDGYRRYTVSKSPPDMTGGNLGGTAKRFSPFVPYFRDEGFSFVCDTAGLSLSLIHI